MPRRKDRRTPRAEEHPGEGFPRLLLAPNATIHQRIRSDLRYLRPEQDPTTSPLRTFTPLANPYQCMEIGVDGLHRRITGIKGIQRRFCLRGPPHQDVALHSYQNRCYRGPGRTTIRAECLSLTRFAARYRIRQRSTLYIAFHAPSLRTM